MKELTFYKHKNCTDMVIRTIVVESFAESCIRGGRNTKLLVEYYNIANPAGEPTPFGVRESIKIKDCDLKNWEEYVAVPRS